MVSKKVLAFAGLGALLLSRSGRSRVSALPASVARGMRRRRDKLPKGVEEFPTTLVDKRFAGAPTIPAAVGETPAEVMVEHYLDHPTRS